MFSARGHITIRFSRGSKEFKPEKRKKLATPDKFNSKILKNVEKQAGGTSVELSDDPWGFELNVRE